MLPVSKASRGRVAALDLGDVRTGVAVSDTGRVVATPLAVVPSVELSGYLRRLFGEEAVAEVVVGVPRTLGGEVGYQARKVLNTLEALREEFPDVRFVEWDERLTTRLAVAGSGGKRRARKGGTPRVDDLAAARMLQEYLRTRGDR
ncbi:MAG: Holliday junction resolvase RuvX [Rubrobacter sp.]